MVKMSLSNFKKRKKGLDLALVICPAWSVIQTPIGISYLKSFLENRNISVKCFDLSMEFYKVFPEKKYWDLNYPEHFITPHLFDREIRHFLNPFIPIWAGRILSCNPKAVGFSLFTSSINTSLLLARHLKKLKPDLFIIGGGAETARVRRLIIDERPLNKDIFTAFDVLIEGEGEVTLREVLLLFRQGRDFHHVDGIFYANEGRIAVNRPRKLIVDLDILSPPDFSDFDIENYTKVALPITTSRGCINRCTFCTDSPLWKIYRFKSPGKIVEDLKFLVNEHGKNQFEIVDSTFNGDIMRIDKFCNLLINSKLDIAWSAKVSLRGGMNYALLQKMREAGCMALSYGVESGSPRVLKDMRKNINIGEAKKIIKDTYKTGIQTNCFFMIGYPTETETDFRMTLDFIEENAGFIYSFDQVTGCHIEGSSYLGLNLEKFGIVFKEDGWYSKDSSPGIRKERLLRFRECARRLHSHYKCEVQL